jgi:branched-chain amino acid aminotransferase
MNNESTCMASKVWYDGKLVDESEARVPLLNHSLQYGSGIFEGIRAYRTGHGISVFRLSDHVRRFMNTARIYRMNIGRNEEEISSAIKETVRANGPDEFYIRPFAFFNSESVSLVTDGMRVSLAVMTVKMAGYFQEKIEKGIRCKVSSWKRINSSILPVEAKASGNYLNSILGSMDARTSGYDEAIFTSGDGYIAEGAGQNIFMVKNGEIVTPGAESAILMGITRDSVIKIAMDRGMKVTERLILRDEIYSADEVFFAGTAAEITPIVSVDGIPIADGKPGKITREILNEYSSIVHGKSEKYRDWLYYV